jgi:hypothetical protein
MAELILYWRGMAEVRHDLINCLSEKQFAIQQCRSLDEVLTITEETPPLAIIVDASAGEREASDRCIDLSTAAPLFKMQLMFISVQATKRTKLLQNNYRMFHPVDVPYRLDKIMARIEQIARGDFDLEKIEAEARLLEARRRFMSENADPAQLSRTLGGKYFSVANTPEDFDDNLLIPAHPSSEVLQGMLRTMNHKNPWLGCHSRRVAYLSSALANSMALGSSRDAMIRLGALMLNWGLRDQDSAVIHHDMFRDYNEDKIRELSSYYRDSSVAAEQKLKDPEVARTILAASELLLSKVPDSKELHENAYCILASELIDRSCWSTGFWNPFGAHSAIKRLREKQICFTNEKINRTLIRVLGEAGSWRVTVHNFFGFDGSGAVTKKSKGPNSRAVSLHELHPGMKLAEPLAAQDGKLILSADTELDEQTLYDLWALAAIRALHRPQIENDYFFPQESAHR